MSEVRDVLREVRLTIGSEGDSGERERQQARVKRMLTAMGVAEEDLDNELRDHKQQQEAAAAEADEGRLNGVDSLDGAAGGTPRQEGVSQDDHRDDVDMEVEEAADAGIDKDLLGRCTPTFWMCVTHSLHAAVACSAPSIHVCCFACCWTQVSLLCLFFGQGG